MLFNSFEFLLFLPIVFLLYWFVFRGRRWQNLLVVVASYVFYGWWNWRFLVLGITLLLIIDHLKNFGFTGETEVVAPGINSKMDVQKVIGVIHRT